MTEPWEPPDTRPYAPASPELIAARQRNRPAEYIPVPVVFADDEPLEPRFFVLKRQAVIWNPWVNGYDTQVVDDRVRGWRFPTWDAANVRAQQLNGRGRG